MAPTILFLTNFERGHLIASCYSIVLQHSRSRRVYTQCTRNETQRNTKPFKHRKNYGYSCQIMGQSLNETYEIQLHIIVSFFMRLKTHCRSEKTMSSRKLAMLLLVYSIEYSIDYRVQYRVQYIRSPQTMLHWTMNPEPFT